METCYKVFRTDAPQVDPHPLQRLRASSPRSPPRSPSASAAIYEVPISYLGRTYHEGKKIGWKDGFQALRAMLKYWLIDDLYAEDEYGSHILHSLERAQRFNRWMADAVAPLPRRPRARDRRRHRQHDQLAPAARPLRGERHQPAYLRLPAQRTVANRRYLEVARLDLEDPAGFEPCAGQFDTSSASTCSSTFRSPRALENIFDALAPGGRLIILVPQGHWLYSPLDKALEHVKRYTGKTWCRSELAGFEIDKTFEFNRMGVVGWALNGKLLRRTEMAKYQLKMYDTLSTRMAHSSIASCRGTGYRSHGTCQQRQRAPATSAHRQCQACLTMTNLVWRGRT